MRLYRFKKGFAVLCAMVVFFLFAHTSSAQMLSNLRQKYIPVKEDTVHLDSLSVIPSTWYIQQDDVMLDTSAYRIDAANAVVIWKKTSEAFKAIHADSVKITYRVFPILFTKKFQHKDLTRIEKEFKGYYNPFSYTQEGTGFDIFKIQGLQSSGSISRGITFGNNQDAVVNSSLNLQLAGKVSDDVEILAAVSDNNVPIQPEGNTQLIQEFDKVFIQLNNANTKLIAGDFELTRPESYFMNFYKKGQGGLFTTLVDLGNKKDTTLHRMMRATASASISKGKFARDIITGIEGNQGTYRLTGAENEQFISILAGSEKVFVDGISLTRGMEYDYVMDYNQAQITFTAKKLITKDSRITVEFQYSDKNYVRSLIYVNDEFEQKNLKIKLNVYSEQDAKNQPLLQSLDDASKKVLADAGDNLQSAVIVNADRVPFNTTEVLYALRDIAIDSVTYPNVFVYSTSPDSAYYRVGFSFIGYGKGNYIIDNTSTANGRVYTFVAPINGIQQGQYEPVAQLIAPQKKQMVTLGADYTLDKNTKISAEGAFSNYDINLFSNKDKLNDKGFAGALRLANEKTLRKEWKLISGLNAEVTDKFFVPVETYRSTEFNRDWNISIIQSRENEILGGLSLGVVKANKHFIRYGLKTFQRGDIYKGWMNLLSAGFNPGKYRLIMDGSYLFSDDTTYKSNFLRGRTDFSRLFKRFYAGIRTDMEWNKRFLPATDSVLPSSYSYFLWQPYIASSDTAIVKYRLDYTQRQDYNILHNSYTRSTISHISSASADLQKNPNSILSATVTYRVLNVTDTVLTSQRDEDNLLSKVEYNFNALKGGISANTYYEFNTGQQQKQSFTFLEVASGTGAYDYAGDYNNNGVKDLDEFEVAAFADRADYIKVFTPTNEFIKTFGNVFSEALNVNPNMFVKSTSGWKWINLFANQLTLRLENKTLSADLKKSLNPFVIDIADTNLVVTNSSFRNTLFFNRSGSVFAMDVTYFNLRNKSFLTSGYEYRSTNAVSSNVRLNISKVISFNFSGEEGIKKNNSELFALRNFAIDYYSIQPKLNLQSNNSFRTTLSYEYNHKKNGIGEIGERSEQDNIGVEFRYSTVKQGIFTAKANFINISYNATENASIAYEMLEGLKKGKNYTWNVSIQRNLSTSLQLSVNYDGRKSENVKTIHTGGVQVRAFF